MIITQIFYGVQCDRCKEIYDDGDHSFWGDKSSPIESACDSDWGQLNGKHYCTDCYKVDPETDEVIVKDPFPKYIKTLNEFIDNILGGLSRRVFEFEDHFLIKCKFYNRPRLQSFEVDFIKESLGNVFISLDYVENTINQFTCIIKVKL